MRPSEIYGAMPPLVLATQPCESCGDLTLCNAKRVKAYERRKMIDAAIRGEQE